MSSQATFTGPADTSSLLILTILALHALTLPPLSAAGPQEATTPIALPGAIEASALTLTPAEERFFASRDGTRAGKWRFRHGTLKGSVLIVKAASWRTHHAPELCLAAGGVEVDAVTPVPIDDGFDVHVVTADGGKATGRAIAVYWFQSATTTTPSLLRRFWRDLAGRESRWVLVSILFDAGPDPGSPDEPLDLLRQDLLRRIHQHVHSQLQPAP